MTERTTGKRRRFVSRRLVVADDDPAMRALVEAVLAPLGHEIIAVQDGAELVELVCRGPAPPALIITDLQMPGVSGMTAVRRIRRAGVTAPIILVTAFGSAAVHADALRFGASAVLDKPFAVTALRELATALLAADDPLASTIRGEPPAGDDDTNEREVG